MATQANEKSGAKNQYSDFFKNFSMPQLNMEAAINAHKKNLEVFSKAHKAALATVKEVNELHGQYAKKMLDDMKSHMENIRNAPSNESRFKTHADSLKNSFENSMNHGREVMNMWSRTHRDITDSFAKRVKDGVEEFKTTIKKKTAKN
ncbi:MAG: phasin family protein [Candidatus Nucleicultricaceae bacterium]